MLDHGKVTVVWAWRQRMTAQVSVGLRCLTVRRRGDRWSCSCRSSQPCSHVAAVARVTDATPSMWHVVDEEMTSR
jgi:hypothetical protein